MPAKNNTNLGLAACFQTNTLLADRNLNRIRLETVFFMLYGKFALVVFAYDIGCLYHKSLKNTTSRLPYILCYRRYRKFSGVACV